MQNKVNSSENVQKALKTLRNAEGEINRVLREISKKNGVDIELTVGFGRGHIRITKQFDDDFVQTTIPCSRWLSETG